MSRANGMTDVEMLVELQAIYRLKARRDHAEIGRASCRERVLELV